MTIMDFATPDIEAILNTGRLIVAARCTADWSLFEFRRDIPDILVFVTIDSIEGALAMETGGFNWFIRLLGMFRTGDPWMVCFSE